MTTVNNATSATDVFNGINQTNADQRITKTENEDNQMFMELLIAQLKNQDPTSPTDTNAFMQQISSMSMVEGITNMNTQMSELSNTMLTSQTALQASSMVGRSIYVEDNVVPIGENGAKSWAEGKIVLGEDTSNLQLKVYGPDGSLIGTKEYGEQDAGNVEFFWQSPVDYVYTDELEDPSKAYDAETNPYKKALVNPDQPYDEQTNPYMQEVVYPAGDYKFVAQITDSTGSNKEVPVQVKVQVNSVTFNGTGTGMEYNTPAGVFTQADVREIAI